MLKPPHRAPQPPPHRRAFDNHRARVQGSLRRRYDQSAPRRRAAVSRASSTRARAIENETATEATAEEAMPESRAADEDIPAPVGTATKEELEAVQSQLSMLQDLYTEAQQKLQQQPGTKCIVM